MYKFEETEISVPIKRSVLAMSANVASLFFVKYFESFHKLRICPSNICIQLMADKSKKNI